MPLSNDDRGWIMTGLSGVACIFGASFICIDILVRQFPGQRDFKIQNSDVFLSVSLSLSFGVMLFSALYKMLPSSKESLEDAGFSPQEASWILIACFVGGVVGIQILSRWMHSFMSHEVVDCEHSHQDEESTQKHAHEAIHHHDESHDTARKTRSRTRKAHNASNMRDTLPKARSERSVAHAHSGQDLSQTFALNHQQHAHERHDMSSMRPSLQERLSASISSLTTNRPNTCRLDEPCYGFSEVCGSDCFKKVSLRGGSRARTDGGRSLERPTILMTESTPLLQHATGASSSRPQTRAGAEGVANNSPSLDDYRFSAAPEGLPARKQNLHKHDSHSEDTTDDDGEEENAEHHHHHVPTNAFLSIGLQTSIAIALHKLPEGFITYATNHANPQLGFSVFLALFIHNITEGFALALPLYLAVNNRLKAMVVAFVLGGLSQPLGAGVAALWFKLAGSSKWAPSEGIYGGMFAVTAGIMASVALQLFSESMDLTHSKQLCMTGAFVGMVMMGVSSALTA